MGLTGSILAGPIIIDVITPAPCPTECYFEATPFYGFAKEHQFEGATGLNKIDMEGVDFTFGKKICANSSMNIRLGYGYGSDSGYQQVGFESLYHRTSVHTFSLMPGYRYTWQMTPELDIFTGANLGIANQSIKGKISNDASRVSGHGSEWGVQYSAEVGVTYDINESWYGLAAFQYLGNTCSPQKNAGNINLKGEKQQYYTLRLGVGMKF